MREGHYKYQITKDKLISICEQLPEGKPLPNRNELAKQCGVARVTLERAISELIGEGVLVSIDGSGTYPAKNSPVSPNGQTEGKVWALLGYSVTVGILPYWIRGIEDFAYAHNISLIVCNTDNDSQKETNYLNRLVKQNVSGIILIPNIHTKTDQSAIDAIRAKKIPIVACSRQVPGENFPGAFQNFFHSGFMATQHLIDQGCRNIAYFSYDSYYSAEDRLQGFLAAIEQFNSMHDCEKAERGLLNGNSEEEFENAINAYLDDNPDTDGIFLGSDLIALPLYKILKKRNLVAGRDIKLIASEDSGCCRCFSVPLSVVQTPFYEMAQLTAQQLLMLQNGTDEELLKREIVSGRLVARESSTGIPEA